MTRAAKPERQTAPRGKSFAVVHCSHVIGADVMLRVLSGRWKLLDDARAAARRIDCRLTPIVTLTEDAA